jgi:hypothetical protein
MQEVACHFPLISSSGPDADGIGPEGGRRVEAVPAERSPGEGNQECEVSNDEGTCKMRPFIQLFLVVQEATV